MIWATLEFGKLATDLNSESMTFNIVSSFLKASMEFIMNALQQAENKGFKTTGRSSIKKDKKRQKISRSRPYKLRQNNKQFRKKRKKQSKRRKIRPGEKKGRRMCHKIGCFQGTTDRPLEEVNNTCSLFRKDDKVVKTVCPTDRLHNVAFSTAELKCKKDLGACVSNMTIDPAKFIKIASGKLGQWAMLEYELSLITEGTSKACKGFPVPCWTGVIESFKYVTTTFIAAMHIAQIVPPPPPEHPYLKNWKKKNGFER